VNGTIVHPDHDELEESICSVYTNTVDVLEQPIGWLSQAEGPHMDVHNERTLPPWTAISSRNSIESLWSWREPAPDTRIVNGTYNCFSNNWVLGPVVWLFVQRSMCAVCRWYPEPSFRHVPTIVSKDNRKVAERCFFARFHSIKTRGHHGFRRFLCKDTIKQNRRCFSVDRMLDHGSKMHNWNEICGGTCGFEGCGDKLPRK
jgi:hypothetical protein